MNPEAVLVVFANIDIVDYLKKVLSEDRMHDGTTLFHHANALTSLKGAENAANRLQLLEGDIRKKIAGEATPVVKQDEVVN